MKNTTIYLITSVIILLSACKKKESAAKPQYFSVSQGTFNDGQVLMVLGEELAFDNKLYKINSSNTIEVVDFKDGNGNSVNLNAISISKGTPAYIALVFSQRSNSADDAYLLNRSTFSLTSIQQYGIPYSYSQAESFMNPVTLYDGKHSLYYRAWASGTNFNIVKIDVSQAPLFSGSYLMSDTTYTFNYDLDKYGNLMVDFQGYHSGQRYKKIYKAAGGAYNVNSTCGNRSFWADIDSNFVYFDCSNAFNKITYNPSSNSNTESIYMTSLVSRNFYRDLSYRINYNNKMIWIDTEIFEWTASSTTPTKITSIPFTSVKLVDHTQANGTLFFTANDGSGQETIFKVNLSNYSYTTVSTPGKYVFNCIETMNDGTIYASATRTSDSKEVFVKFSPSGVETLLDDTINRKAMYMVKVNEY